MEHDIWAAADFLIKRYGEHAATIVDVRHDRIKDQGNTDELIIWKRIQTAIREMLSDVAPEGARVH
jgi:hypothetical protein